MLDAPVSGSVPQVSGDAHDHVGGDEHAYARVEPISELGAPTHIGENGQGLVLKLAINIGLAAQTLRLLGGLAHGRSAGIDPSSQLR